MSIAAVLSPSSQSQALKVPSLLAGSGQDYVSKVMQVCMDCFQECYSTHRLEMKGLQADRSRLLQEAKSMSEQATLDKVEAFIMRYTPSHLAGPQWRMLSKLDQAINKLSANPFEPIPVSFIYLGSRVVRLLRNEINQVTHAPTPVPGLAPIPHPDIKAGIAARWAALGCPAKAQTVIDHMPEGTVEQKDPALFQIALAWLAEYNLERCLAARDKLSDTKLQAKIELEIALVILEGSPLSAIPIKAALYEVPADRWDPHYILRVMKKLMAYKALDLAVEILQAVVPVNDNSKNNDPDIDSSLSLVITSLIIENQLSSALEMTSRLSQYHRAPHQERLAMIYLSQERHNECLQVFHSMEYSSATARASDAIWNSRHFDPPKQPFNLFNALVKNEGCQPVGFVLEYLLRSSKTPLIEAIRNDLRTPYVLHLLVKALLDHPGDVKKAEEVAELITDPEKRSEAFYEIAHFLIKKGEVVQAKQRVDTMPDSAQKSEWLECILSIPSTTPV